MSAPPGSASIVYVVDDDASTRELLAWLMKRNGLRAEVFADARAFLAAYRFDQPGVLVLDLNMPGMSGLDLQRHLAGSGNRMPVILITAFPLDHVRRQAEAEGAVGFFTKPFDARLMIDCIERALVRKGDP